MIAPASVKSVQGLPQGWGVMAVGCFFVLIIVCRLYTPWPREERCTIIQT